MSSDLIFDFASSSSSLGRHPNQLSWKFDIKFRHQHFLSLEHRSWGHAGSSRWIVWILEWILVALNSWSPSWGSPQRRHPWSGQSSQERHRPNFCKFFQRSTTSPSTLVAFSWNLKDINLELISNPTITTISEASLSSPWQISWPHFPLACVLLPLWSVGRL